QFQSFCIDLLGLCGIESIKRGLDRGGAAAEADLQPPAAHLIEHADLLDEPNGMVKWQRINQRAEAEPARALRYGSQKHAGRRRHAERCRVMFRHMIGIETRLIISLDELEACLVIILQRQISAVEMVEYAEFHRIERVPSVVTRNLMRFADESTVRVSDGIMESSLPLTCKSRSYENAVHFRSKGNIWKEPLQGWELRCRSRFCFCSNPGSFYAHPQ